METSALTHDYSTDPTSLTNIEQDIVADMKRVLEVQKQAFADEGAVSLQARIDRLQRTRTMIGENQQDIIDTCNLDFGNHSRHQAHMSEVMGVMDGMKRAIKNLPQWMQDERRKVDFPMNLLGAKAKIQHQPKGVVGNISTWNFPVYVSILPLAGIFAAGNRAMIKLSEVAPATADLLQGLVAEYFDESECAAITGGPHVGNEFAALPFDHIIFTGGTGIARHILAAAAANLTPVTLELGGKSPVIVGRSYDLRKAAERIMVGKGLNVGQACLAPDYCFVPKEKKEDFISSVTDQVAALFPTMVNNPDYTSVINGKHHQRIVSMIEDARSKGGDVRELNPADEDFSEQAEGMHKVPLTLVVEPSDDMLVMQEELFGPILCIKTYSDISECIQYINGRSRPLGFYYFGEDALEERHVLGNTISGGATVNDVLAHASCDDLPFGGIGHSGMGSYHGHHGFLTFSHQRAVYRQTKIGLMKLAGMTPPYGEKCKKQLDKMTKV